MLANDRGVRKLGLGGNRANRQNGILLDDILSHVAATDGKAVQCRLPTDHTSGYAVSCDEALLGTCMKTSCSACESEEHVMPTAAAGMPIFISGEECSSVITRDAKTMTNESRNICRQ